MPAPRSMAASWLSSRRQTWLRPPSAPGGAALGAAGLEGGALGGVGAENGKLNCASAGAVQRMRAGNAPRRPRRTVAIDPPIMQAGPIMATTLSPVNSPRENRGESSAKPLQALGLFIDVGVNLSGKMVAGMAAMRPTAVA